MLKLAYNQIRPTLITTKREEERERKRKREREKEKEAERERERDGENDSTINILIIELTVLYDTLMVEAAQRKEAKYNELVSTVRKTG